MTIKCLNIFFLFLLLCSLNVISTFAQEPDTLQEVSIIKQKLLFAGEGQSIRSFDKEILDKYRHDEISKLLSEKAGFYVKTNGPNGLATLSIRGLSANNTKLYWNNISISSPTLGLSDLSLLPGAFFNNVNVNVGAAGMIDGSGGQGGSVNLLNSASGKKGHNVGLNIRVNPALSSTSRLLTHSWSDGKFEIQTNFIIQDAKNDFPFYDRQSVPPIRSKRENAGLKRVGVANNLYYRIRKGEEISIKTMHMQNDKELAPAIGATNNMQSQNDNSWRGLISWNKNSKKYYHGVGLALTNDYSNYKDQVVFIDSEFEVDVITGYYHVGYTVLPKVVLGAKFTGAQSNVKSSGFDDDVLQNSLSVLGTLDYELPKNGGVVLSVRKQVTSESDHGFTPAINTFVRPFQKENIKLKASVANNIRIPTLNDLYWEVGGNPNLLDENSINIEAGIEYKEGKTMLEVVYYNSLTDNWIQWMPQSGGFWSPINISKVRSEGMEVSLAIKSKIKQAISNSFLVRYTYNIARNIDFKNDENLVGKELIYAPNHQIAINSSFRFREWIFSYEQKITSRIFLDPLNNMYLPYTAPANIDFSYVAMESSKKSVVLAMAINNIFDEEYQIQPNYPMPLRNITMSLSIDF